MADIWSNVGGGFTPQGEDWLYQRGGQVHGPVPKQAIVDKLMRGDMDPKTQVAKEGGDFHPISQVAAFQEALEALNQVMKKRAASKMRLVLVFMVLVIGAVGAGAAFYFKQESDKRNSEIAKDIKAKEAKLKAAAAERRKLINSDQVELVALVSFDETQMKVGGQSKGSSRPKSIAGPCVRIERLRASVIAGQVDASWIAFRSFSLNHFLIAPVNASPDYFSRVTTHVSDAIQNNVGILDVGIENFPAHAFIFYSDSIFKVIDARARLLAVTHQSCWPGGNRLSEKVCDMFNAHSV